MRPDGKRRPPPGQLRRLAEMIRAIECPGGSVPGVPGEFPGAVATGWADVDGPGAGIPGANSAYGGLARGVIHEWFGLADPLVPASRGHERSPCPPNQVHDRPDRPDRPDRVRRAGRDGGGSPWTPPLLVLTHLAWRALEPAGSSGRVVWIGRRIWPNPRALIRGDGSQRRLLNSSLFVDLPQDTGRLWAIDLALRCPAVAAVVADGSGLGMPQTRRLQLAAEAGSACALLARPPVELSVLSAAATRWRVCREPSPGRNPRWTVELLRCKGMQSFSRGARVAAPGTFGPGGVPVPGVPGAGAGAGARWWVMEWDRAKGAVTVLCDVVDRSGDQTRSAPAFAGSSVARRTA